MPKIVQAPPALRYARHSKDRRVEAGSEIRSRMVT